MKQLLFSLVLLTCISLSCQNTSATESNHNTAIEIVLPMVDDSHPNKEQMEWMLNNYEDLFMIGEHPSHMLEDSLVLAQEYFTIYQSDLSLHLVFCNTQADALALGEKYFSPTENNQKYGVNGAVLFVVSGTDTYQVNDVLSWFTGEE